MKIFLTGGSGILGTDLIKEFESNNHEVLAFNSSSIQISDYSDVKAKVVDFHPDIIVHSAAMTNVDLCEVDKNSAIATNVIGSQNMSRAACYVGAKIVYISSCGVYGDCKTDPHTELDATNPVNYHHFTKLEGEKRIKEFSNDFLIVRPGWLFGGSQSHKKNFVEARRKEASNAQILKSASDKFGSPSYTGDVAKQIIKLIHGDFNGTFNVVNEGCASRHAYVAEIISLFQFSCKVDAVDSSQFPRRANMPNNECLNNLALNLVNANIMRDWRDALKDYINTYY